MSKIPLTVSGAERLRGELQRLKTVDRPAAISAIGEARLHGAAQRLQRNARLGEMLCARGQAPAGLPRRLPDESACG